MGSDDFLFSKTILLVYRVQDKIIWKKLIFDKKRMIGWVKYQRRERSDIDYQSWTLDWKLIENPGGGYGMFYKNYGKEGGPWCENWQWGALFYCGFLSKKIINFFFWGGLNECPFIPIPRSLYASVTWTFSFREIMIVLHESRFLSNNLLTLFSFPSFFTQMFSP